MYFIYCIEEVLWISFHSCTYDVLFLDKIMYKVWVLNKVKGRIRTTSSLCKFEKGWLHDTKDNLTRI